MAKAVAQKWEFRARFRRNSFGWKSQPAVKRIKEAVAEIKKVARKDKVLAAEGSVLFLEKVSPAIAHVAQGNNNRQFDAQPDPASVTPPSRFIVARKT